MEWFRHDVTAHDDRKIRMILKKGGLAALGAFWWITEMLYASDGFLSDEEISQELDIMDGLNVKDLLIESGLFSVDEHGMWSSNRILEEIRFEADRKEHFRRIGKAGAEAKLSARQAYAEHTPSARQAPIPLPRTNNICSSSSPSQEENLSINKISESDKTGTTCAELPQEAELNASDPVFLTIISNTKEEVPVRESFVRMLEETYPAVSVRSELKAMKAWCISNPKNRKTKAGMKAFINNWLKRDQDRTGRIPQHSYDTIRGTNIGMSLVADGTRPEYPEEKVVFQ